MSLAGHDLRTLVNASDATLAEMLRQWCYELWRTGHDVFPAFDALCPQAHEPADTPGEVQILSATLNGVTTPTSQEPVDASSELVVTLEEPAPAMTGLQLYQWRQDHGHIT